MTKRFHDYYRNSRPVISFEVFPPKTPKAMARLERVLPELVALGPDFMTVTYGAGGSTQDKTLAIAKIIRGEHNKNAACHLTCVGASRADLDQILTDIRAAGIDNIVALRGDPPSGQTEFVPAPDGCRYGNELLEHIRRFEADRGLTPAGIAVAGYPETHSEAPDFATDLANLKRKVAAGADVIITQMFFDNRFFFDYEKRVREIGITLPLVPGLMPVQSAQQIRRMAQMCGSSIPDDLGAALDDAGDDTQKTLDIGARHCARQAKELFAQGVPGIHFYVLNRAEHMAQIMDEIRR